MVQRLEWVSYKDQKKVRLLPSPLMTKEIDLRIASWEHSSKQPLRKRYALFCQEGLNGGECESAARLGYLDDFGSYKEVKKGANRHLHPVVIKFYPNEKKPQASKKFIKDLKEEYLKR